MRKAVIAGSGIWWDGAWKQLRAFAQNGGFPVFLNGSGRGALPPDHELFFQHARRTAFDDAAEHIVGEMIRHRIRPPDRDTHHPTEPCAAQHPQKYRLSPNVRTYVSRLRCAFVPRAEKRQPLTILPAEFVSISADVAGRP